MQHAVSSLQDLHSKINECFDSSAKDHLIGLASASIIQESTLLFAIEVSSIP